MRNTIAVKNLLINNSVKPPQKGQCKMYLQFLKYKLTIYLCSNFFLKKNDNEHLLLASCANLFYLLLIVTTKFYFSSSHFSYTFNRNYNIHNKTWKF